MSFERVESDFEFSCVLGGMSSIIEEYSVKEKSVMITNLYQNELHNL